MQDVIVGKKWRLNNNTTGFLLGNNGIFYSIVECGQYGIGDWIIDGDLIKYRYYQNSQEVTILYGSVSEYSSTQIKLLNSSDPTITITDVYTTNYIEECTYVPDDSFEAYLEGQGIGNGVPNDDYVATSNIKNVTELNLAFAPYILPVADLTGIEDFTALTTLYCPSYQLTTLDVSNNTALTTLSCGGYSGQQGQLTSLDVSNNPALTHLHCQYNQLTTLNVSQNTALTRLYCDNNQLTSLDISQNTALTRLVCQNNQLTTLDVSTNTALTHLHCMDNQLTSLDVSQNTALIYLDCRFNQLTTLDVRNGNNVGMHCSNNPNLTCINVNDTAWSTFNMTFGNGNIDPQHYFSENCP